MDNIFTYGDKYCLLNMKKKRIAKKARRNLKKPIYPIFLPWRFKVSVPDILYCETFGLDVAIFVDIRRTDVRPIYSARLNEKSKRVKYLLNIFNQLQLK